MKLDDIDIDFKDKISTVDIKGKRKWIYAVQPGGKFYNIRTVLSIIFLVLFFTLPFVRVNGLPFLQFNIPEATFIIFGKVFLPQDFVILGLIMVTTLLFVIVFTLLFGRVFCGWVCPQTIFLEMVFRRIEYWIEGSAAKQQKADNGTWTREMYIRKTIKHILYFIISFIFSNLFLSYIIGTDNLLALIKEPLSENIGSFLAIVLFTGVFYLDFAYVREIVCTVICPYGRLQSVLLNKKSIVVAYDYNRGEPRKRYAKIQEPEVGDCIDCGLCVHVCPTGIDIRNGTQMECVHCTACIDACNAVMEKIKRPLNLIRYTSEHALETKEPPMPKARIWGYSLVLVALSVLFLSLISNNTIFNTTILRSKGQILQEVGTDTISNLYTIKITNKHTKVQPFSIELEENIGKIEIVGHHLDSLKATASTEETFFIKVDKKHIDKRKMKLHLKIMNNKEVVDVKPITFIGKR